MTQQQFEPKQLLFREGEVAEHAYIIRSGQVEILKHAEHGEVQLAVLDSGQVLGEMALFEKESIRSATARSLTDVTVDIISVDALHHMLQDAPESLRLIVSCLTQRLKETNQRLASLERATVDLGYDIETISIQAGDERIQSLLEPKTIPVANLPFSIGGYPQNEEPPHENDLELPCEGPPLMVSKKHLRIERQSDGVYLVDVGSRFCSIVNGQVIGRGKVSNKAALQPGENRVVLGDHTSMYILLLVCE